MAVIVSNPFLSILSKSTIFLFILLVLIPATSLIYHCHNHPMTNMMISFANGLVTGNIRIVGHSGTAQLLPGSYVNTIPRWILEKPRQIEKNLECIVSESSPSLVRLLGNEHSHHKLDLNHSLEEPNFVDPTSNTEVWWPADLHTIQARPTLDIFIQSATPRYVFGGLQLQVPSSVSKDGKEWTNFGLNCQPLASQWTSFSLAVETGFRVETFYGRHLQMDTERDNVNTPDRNQETPVVDWKELHPTSKCTPQQTKSALNLLGNLLAELDDSSPLLNGMHILSIPLGQDKEDQDCSMWIDLPLLDSNPKDTYNLVSIGTVESDAKELLSLDDDIITMSGCSMLNVNVKCVAPGSESEFIPRVYHPLYIGLT